MNILKLWVPPKFLIESEISQLVGNEMLCMNICIIPFDNNCLPHMGVARINLQVNICKTLWRLKGLYKYVLLVFIVINKLHLFKHVKATNPCKVWGLKKLLVFELTQMQTAKQITLYLLRKKGLLLLCLTLSKTIKQNLTLHKVFWNENFNKKSNVWN